MARKYQVFEQPDGKPVCIDTSDIISVEPNEHGARIHVGHGISYVVTADFDTVIGGIGCEVPMDEEMEAASPAVSNRRR